MKTGNHDDELVSIEKHATFYAVAYVNFLQGKCLLDERIRRQHAFSGKDGPLTEDELDFLVTNRAAEERTAVVTVIFCALALEAFINDYGISSFSRSFFDHYLDRLDAVSKWVIYPHLISGKPIRTGGQAFESLRRLFSLRNKLVHFKSTQKRACDLDESDRVSIEHASGAIQTVRMAVDELKKLDGQVKTRWVTEAQKITLE